MICLRSRRSQDPSCGLRVGMNINDGVIAPRCTVQWLPIRVPLDMSPPKFLGDSKSKLMVDASPLVLSGGKINTKSATKFSSRRAPTPSSPQHPMPHTHNPPFSQKSIVYRAIASAPLQREPGKKLAADSFWKLVGASIFRQMVCCIFFDGPARSSGTVSQVVQPKLSLSILVN